MARTETAPHWDLAKLYAGPGDPRIEADLAVAAERARGLRARYHGRVAGLSAEALAEALRALEAHQIALTRIGVFAMLGFSANTEDAGFKALYARIRTALTEVHNELQFFDLELQQAPEASFQALLDAPAVAPYAYYLSRVRKYTPHTLSEAEERVMAIKDITGASAWSQLYTELTSAMTVRLALPAGERTLTVSEARALRADPDRETRRAATVGVLEAHAEQSHVLSYIFNTVFEDHRQDLALRHYDDPMAPTLLGEDLPREVVTALMGAVEANYHLAQRYYRVKARVLGLDDFASHDVLAPFAQETREVPYAEGQRIVLESFASFSPRFEAAARGFFENGYVDVPPAPGKQGGAFCSGNAPGLHPYVLLNYTNRLDDVMTVAHELGHGIHFLLAGERQNLYNYYPITPLAETASTFAEMVTVNRLLALESDPAVRRQLLASRIEDAVATIMRQVMYTRWEEKAHAERAKDVVSVEAFCALWAAENEKLYGDTVARTDWDRWGWITIPHLVKSRFYCYSYAFGQLLVYALYQQYREEGAAFVPKFEDVLAAGGSAPATEILSRIGIDIRDPAFWQKGLTLLEEMLREFEDSVA